MQVLLVQDSSKHVMNSLQGMAIFSFPHQFELALILWCIIFILLGRALNIFPLSYVCNRFRSNQITKKMMTIMWFSGLRGAIAYALSLHLGQANDIFSRILRIRIYNFFFYQILHTVRKFRNMNRAKQVSNILICGANDLVEHVGKRI